MHCVIIRLDCVWYTSSVFKLHLCCVVFRDYFNVIRVSLPVLADGLILYSHDIIDLMNLYWFHWCILSLICWVLNLRNDPSIIECVDFLDVVRQTELSETLHVLINKS